MRFSCLAFTAFLVAPSLLLAQDRERQIPTTFSSFAQSEDGIPILFEVRGDSSGTPALVLIHGWSHNHTFWEPHLSSLAASYQVVALDLAGFGESGSGRTEWTMEAFGKDVIAVVEEMQLNEVVILGFSMGASVALEAAIGMPDRVVGVILVDALKNPARQRAESEIQARIASWREQYGTREWVRNLGFNEATPESYVDRCLDMIAPTAQQHWWDALVESSRWTGPRAHQVLEQIEAPVAAIASDRVPIDTVTYRQYVPSFTVRTMPGVGHLGVLWQNTEEFDRHVRELVRSWIGVGLSEHRAVPASACESEGRR